MNKLVYIAEDETLLREAYKRVIYKYFKFVEIKDFDNWEWLIEEIDKKNPDIIICDLVRPKDKLHPIEFLKTINEKIDRDKTKIIIASWNLLNFFKDIYEYCDEFLLKPFGPEDLLKRIEFIFYYGNKTSINSDIVFLYNNIIKINDIIDCINYNFFNNYNIESLIISHWRNNTDIFDLPKSKREVVSYLSTLSTFFDRFNIWENNTKNKQTLNLLEAFLKEKNINISFKWLRDIKKLRNSYPNHLNSKELFQIYKDWWIKDISDYELISITALKKLIIFLEELKKISKK